MISSAPCDIFQDKNQQLRFLVETLPEIDKTTLEIKKIGIASPIRLTFKFYIGPSSEEI